MFVVSIRRITALDVCYKGSEVGKRPAKRHRQMPRASVRACCHVLQFKEAIYNHVEVVLDAEEHAVRVPTPELPAWHVVPRTKQVFPWSFPLAAMSFHSIPEA